MLAITYRIGGTYPPLKEIPGSRYRPKLVVKVSTFPILTLHQFFVFLAT